MKDSLGVSPSKGNQGTTRGFDSHRGQNNIFFTSSGFLIPFTRANPQWAIHGFTLIYTSELILCFTNSFSS